MFALETVDSTEQWQFDRKFVAPPTVADGVVFAGDGSVRFHAFDAATGEWRYADQTIDIDESGTDDGGGGDSGTDGGGGDGGTDDGDDGGGDDGLGPGLGPAATLAGLGGAGYLLRQRRDDGDAP